MTEQTSPYNKAIETILGSKSAPNEDEEKTPQWWLEHLKQKESVLNKDDNTDSYDNHAEVMAKYIIEAYQSQPGLIHAPNKNVYLKPTDWNNPIVLMWDLSDLLEKHIYTNKDHPFRIALSEATGFTWGWAYNIARYALGLPPMANPAIMTIDVSNKKEGS